MNTSPAPLDRPELHVWQHMVHMFHLVTDRPVGDYKAPAELRGDQLALRIRLIKEEHAELMAAHQTQALVAMVDGLCDLAYVVLGTFCAAGKVCRNRFGILLDTVVCRGWSGFARPLNREVTVLNETTRAVIDWMIACDEDNVAFARWDLLDAVMVQLAHTCCATGIDIRPLFVEVHVNNLTKVGGPVVNGKLMKPADYKPVDLRPLLRAQGVGEEWLS